MNLKFAALVMLVGYPFFDGRAAEARRFEGMFLEELGQTRQLKGMPEVYEVDPSNRRRYRQRSSVVQLPLGEAWLSFNPDLEVSYLNKVPGEDAAIYFGPITGDPFELFKLEDRYVAKLRGDRGGDIPYRLDLLIRSGNAPLRQRAVRMMVGGLAADVPANVRADFLSRFKESAAALPADETAVLRRAIQETERRIDELTVTLPDSDYGPGNEELARQKRLPDWMEPGRSVPAAAWGEAIDGLRAAAVFSTVTPRPGQEITVWILVENVSDREIRFGVSDVTQQARPEIFRTDGARVETKAVWFSGLSPIQRFELRPGERLTLARKSLVFAPAGAGASPAFGGNQAIAGSGEYRVRYESILNTGTAWHRQDDGVMHRILPAKGEWRGQVISGSARIVVADSDQKTSR